jgi:cytochrome P450
MTRSFSDPDLAATAFKADPFPYFAHLRATDPIHRIKLRSGQTAWLITRYDDAVSVLADQRFAKDPSMAREKTKPFPLPRILRALERTMLDVDEPDHRRLRTLVQKAFTPRVVEGLRPRIQSITDNLLDRIASREPVDLVKRFALPLPVTVIADMLGVDEEDRPRFHRWSKNIVAADASPWRMLLAMPDAIAFVLFLRQLIRRRTAAPQDDLLSQLTLVEDGGDHLSSHELIAMAFLLLIAGHETTVNLIGNGVLALLQHPSELELLRQNPALIVTAVEEMLRFGSPLQLATERYASEDLQVAGVTIPRGALVYVALASANRDEQVFADADRFDLRRQPNRHLAFGSGIHYCLGAPLARLEGQVAISRLVERFPHMKLAGRADDLRWRRGLVLRGLEALSVQCI